MPGFSRLLLQPPLPYVSFLQSCPSTKIWFVCSFWCCRISNRLSCMCSELSLMYKFYKLSNCVLCHVYHFSCPVQSGSSNMCLPVNVFWLLPKHKLCFTVSSTTDWYFPFLFCLFASDLWWLVVLHGGALAMVVLYGALWWSMVVLLSWRNAAEIVLWC